MIGNEHVDVSDREAGGSGGVPAAAAATPASTRTIVEYCTGPDSRIGRPGLKPRDCNVVRLTETEDLEDWACPHAPEQSWLRILPWNTTSTTLRTAD